MIIVTNDIIPQVQDDTILIVEQSKRQPPREGRLKVGHYYPSTNNGKAIWKALDQDIPTYINGIAGMSYDSTNRRFLMKDEVCETVFADMPSLFLDTV